MKEELDLSEHTNTQASMAQQDAGRKNKLDFVPTAPTAISYNTSNSIGRTFAHAPSKLPTLSGKVGFVIREGTDPIAGDSTGTLMENCDSKRQESRSNSGATLES